ncbi:MAG: SIS domain-containing protein [Planctomycetia bacterium]|nr:SIS domain-containing protein [Planctomycetia bacterium]
MDKKSNIINYFHDYRNKLDDLLDKVDLDILFQIIQIMIKTFKNGKTIFICGNGGSAATASHLQADFIFYMRYFTKFRPKVRALTDNVPMITAVSNDTSYDDIFIEQLKGQFEDGDAIICISASGNSENVVRAAKYANEHGGTSIAFVGFSGGKLLKEAKISLYTENPKGEYGPIEDMHMIYDHILVNYLAQDKEFLEIPES